MPSDAELHCATKALRAAWDKTNLANFGLGAVAIDWALAVLLAAERAREREAKVAAAMQKD